MKETIAEMGDTISTSVRGSSRTAYNLEPTVWLKEIMDAAKKRHFFMSACYVTDVPKGNKDVIIPYVKNYLKNTGTFADQTTQGSAVSFTTINNLEGLQLSPSPHFYGVGISNYALEVNAVDLINRGKEELVYNAGDVVDREIAAALRDATLTTSSVAGAQDLYGGDASSAATLEAGDILSTDLVADAKTRLMSTTAKYYTGGASTACTGKKNGWFNEGGDFLLFISPEQENAFLKDSQFVNASEYGSNSVVLNGEIGSYLGIKIIVSANTPAAGDGGDAGTDRWGSGDTLQGHMCLLVKAKKCAAFAWGRAPKLNVFNYDREDETDITLVMDYATSAFYTDATVKIFVTDA